MRHGLFSGRATAPIVAVEADFGTAGSFLSFHWSSLLLSRTSMLALTTSLQGLQLQSPSLLGWCCLHSGLVYKRLCSEGKAFLLVWSLLRARQTACPSGCDHHSCAWSVRASAGVPQSAERTCSEFLLAPRLSCLRRSLDRWWSESWDSACGRRRGCALA